MARGCVSPEEQAADLRKEVSNLRAQLQQFQDYRELLLQQINNRDAMISWYKQQLRNFMTEDS